MNEAMCIDSVDDSVYSTMCVYAQRVVAWLI